MFRQLKVGESSDSINHWTGTSSDLQGRVVDESDNKEWVSRERTYGSFARQISLGKNVDINNITAHYDNGVLTIEVPVSEESKPRKIEVGKSSTNQITGTGPKSEDGQDRKSESSETETSSKDQKVSSDSPSPSDEDKAHQDDKSSSEGETSLTENTKDQIQS